MAETTGKVSNEKDTAKTATQISPPSINLPKGGGAIRGMGEKFAANPVTGTGSMTVPIATSPGRSGFGPQLSLSYDSGAGNGPFGFGWSLSLPTITRKTEKGLPKYLDAEDSDVFLLSGSEDLVPTLIKNAAGTWEQEGIPDRTVGGRVYRVRRYRPRIEGLFARIERWTNQADPADVFWRSLSRDNMTTWYGKTAESRIADPNNPARIFSWLISQSYDDKGNAVIYEYAIEDSARIFENLQGDPLTKAHEKNRTDRTRASQRYLHRIKYGNRTPNRHLTSWEAIDPVQLPPDDWMFEVVFDYEQGHYAESPPNVDQVILATASVLPPTGAAWPVRPDPFSNYRAGFEVRTYRLCQRVLMFHHFPAEAEVGADCLVRSTDFIYEYEEDAANARAPIYSFLRSVTQSGYRREGTQYLKKSLPPVQFEYSRPVEREAVEEVDPEYLEHLPIGLDGSTYRWTDLHGEGIPGILTEQAGAWYYKRNLSPMPQKLSAGGEHVTARFAALETVALKPNIALHSGAEFMDLAGDGQPDLVIVDSPGSGLFEHDEADGWHPFQPFTAPLNRDTGDPNLRFVDLDGDGHPDILVTEEEAFVWHPSLGEKGFGPAQRVAQAFDEEKGPRIVFADGTQSIYLADMSGDGLTDIVRIRNGEVCYWPNFGRCRFGAKITMDQAPRFDKPDLFNQKRIRLADLDGSGTTDIIYLHDEGVRLYFNQSGNSWSHPRALKVFPAINDAVSIIPIDVLGNGTTCLVWSSPLPGDTRHPMRYVKLMGDQKPHLLVKTINNLGAETRVEYAPSTKFYLQDKQDGKPWVTRLPFPVHVVEQVTTYDHISRNRFVTHYAYHHGYFDGIEREFRGFGMVEQWDTEEFAALRAGEQASAETNLGLSSHVPPVVTKSWFHTGVYDEVDEVSRHFAAEYYGAPKQSTPNDAAAFDAFYRTLLPDTVLPLNLAVDEEREAGRALKGSMLRQEIYAQDGTDKAQHPYTVTEQNFTIRTLQPQGNNRHSVFFTHARESVSYHYERMPADPRVSHALTLEVDDFGNVRKSVAIGYGRRIGQSPLQGTDREKQEQLLMIYTENDVTNAIDGAAQADDYRTPLPSEARTYEVTGFTLDQGAERFAFEEFAEKKTQALTGLREIPYEHQTDHAKKQKRLIERVRTLYRPNDCGVVQSNSLALLPLGALESLAFPGESYKLAFTPGLAKLMYGDSNKLSQAELDALLANDGKYMHSQGDAHWWIPSGRLFYSSGSNDIPTVELAEARAHFFLPRRYRDPFHTDEVKTESFVTYDRYNLLVEETRDALGNRVTVGERDADPTQPLLRHAQDYRVLQPALIMDPNRNRSAVVFDTLGMVVGTAVMGKPQPAPVEGDVLEGFIADVTQAQLDQFMREPRKAVRHTRGSTASQVVHDLLNKATTRIVYDLDRFTRLGEPAFAATVARETHTSDLDKTVNQKSTVQISFSYSDGFGREIQKKIQAESGKVPQRDAQGTIILDEDGQPKMTKEAVSPRWVGSGWTIFNNKGKPVRQYEPFFSATHDFEFGVIVGVSPVLFYDPAERVIATLHPNHTYEKVVFDPWQQTTYDVNDTCAARNDQIGDPRTDPDISGYVGEYFKMQSVTWQTWHAQRIGGALGQDERNAALRAEAHADTPTTAHFDALGRPFLTVARNRVVCTNHALDGTEEQFATRVELDIEGNQRAVRDAIVQAGDPLGRIVMRYAYDMLGTRIHQLSMEAGARWMLNDVAGKPIRAWDSRGHEFSHKYDPLRRPTETRIKGGDGPVPLDHIHEKIIYGEDQSLNGKTDQELNLRGKPFTHYDTAGKVGFEEYDFKGNLRKSRRWLATNYKSTPDWGIANPDSLLETKDFPGETEYDALNRPVTMITPDNSVIRPGYNEANLLERVDANLRGQTSANGQPMWTPFVTNIDYDAKGQRTGIDYGTRDGKGITTSYAYDPDTFRLIHLQTRRNAAAFDGTDRPGEVQNLHYAYDPTGNITHIRDDAQQTIYFKGQIIEPSNDYTYDAVYRLIQATGREHLGQGGASIPHSHNDAGRIGVLNADAAGLFAPNDRNAMDRYCEKYMYDEVGNFKEMSHHRSCPAAPSWTRTYAYDEPSLIEANKRSNRLSKAPLQSDPPSATKDFGYDAHGNMTRMPHLPLMRWDYRDQLMATAQQVVNNGMPETTWYTYDASGQRVRKVTESMVSAQDAANGRQPVRLKERIYLGGFDIYREYENDGVTPKLERETLHVMDDKQRIALVETKTIDTQSPVLSPQPLIRHQFGNHLGSAGLELDEQAQIISYEEYTPYGSTSYQAVRSQTETAKRYRYAGKERDEESGFSYYGVRHYVAWLGRWTAPDPLGFVDGVNLFVFVGGNPIVRSDKKGFAAADVADINQTNGKANSLDQNDPDNCVSFESFARGAEGPFTEQGLSDAWRESRGTDISEDDGFQFSDGVSTTPSRTRGVGTSNSSDELAALVSNPEAGERMNTALMKANDEQSTLSARGQFNERFAFGAEVLGVGLKFERKKFEQKTSTLEIPKFSTRQPIYEGGTKDSFTLAFISGSREITQGPGGSETTKDKVCVAFVCVSREENREGTITGYGLEASLSASVGLVSIGGGVKLVGEGKLKVGEETLQTSIRGEGSLFIPIDQRGLPSPFFGGGVEARLELSGPPQPYK